MGDEATELAEAAEPDGASSDRDAAILRFPSNRPLDSPSTADGEPRLRDVIGDVLRDERLRQERTLGDVAEDASVSLPYLSEVERGRKEVSSDVLRSIGDALDLPLVDILERSADRLRVDMSAGPRVQTHASAFRLAA